MKSFLINEGHNMKKNNIDGGNAFDWGKTSKDYAKYRDIYPNEFYKRIVDLGLCVKGQNVLDWNRYGSFAA